MPVIAYVAALAPVLFAGRPSFSSYGVLTDSALHMLGADFLIRHGQDFSHLDLRNSPGQYLNDYYNTYYPSGADTFFGGSALLVRAPLIWAFQPFNAFMLALCTGPAWVLVRRLGLDGWLAALATLTVTLPALVYGYELIASVKEITSLPLILGLGALVVLHPRWLRGPPRGAIPFALLVAAGVSALGVAFGAWALTAVIVLVAIVVRDMASGDGASDRSSARGLLPLTGVGLLVAFVAALGTWLELSGSLQIARNIASTNNPGNLQNPLRTVQILGTWLVSSYKHVPAAGGDLTVSYALSLLALAAAVLGAAYVVHRREYALAAWIALTLAVWLGLTAYGTTWADGKALMLTSPVVVLLAWAGVAALRDCARSRPALRPLLAPAALLLALALAGGVAASDALQYHGSNLAPTARYEELASIDSRFAGRGPALFTDYDEYSLYLLRDLDVGGPGFMYPPPADRADRGPAGEPRPDLPGGAALLPADRHPPRPRGLAASGRIPPAVPGRLLRSLGAPPRRDRGARPCRCAEHAGSSMPARCRSRATCQNAWRSARRREPGGDDRDRRRKRLAPGMGRVTGRTADVTTRPPGGHVRCPPHGYLGPVAAGRDHARSRGERRRPSPRFDLRPAHRRRHRPRHDRAPAHSLTAGPHRLMITRGSSSLLAPGSGGSAILDSIFLTPVGAGGQATLHVTPTAQWRSLCEQRLEWIEVVPS